MPDAVVDPARHGAADLFAAAGRRLDLPGLTRLECLAAEAALGVFGQPLDDASAALDSRDLIVRALDTLRSVPIPERDDGIREAARRGRQALREMAD